MSAIRLLQAEHQEEIQHLHRQLMSGGILQKELWKEAERFLIQRKIYDVTLAEEQDLREYKKSLLDSGNYTKRKAIEMSSALRKIHQYRVETEYGELISEIQECRVSDEALKGNVRSFLIRQGIHHIRDIDYTIRNQYEMELQKIWDRTNVMRYLKLFDHIKQYSVKKEIGSLQGKAKYRRDYQAQIVFLPYLPDLELVKDFEYVRDKKELVWDFSRKAPEKIKRQVFLLLNYILDNLYRDNPKERRVRYLLPLHWLYDFCVEEDIEDLEGMEVEQIQRFEKIVEHKVVNVKNSMQIIDNSRKILFLTAPEIHWHANVWYMERFHLAEDRLNPSNPVQRLSFIEVINKKNRVLLQEYAKYHVGIGGLTIANIRGQLYEIKRLLEYFKEEESICKVDEKQLDVYFKRLGESNTKDDTFNKRIVHYLKFYQFLNVRGYIEEIPFKPEYYLKKTYLEHHDRMIDEKIYMEILHKLYTFPLTLRLIFLHLWCTGLRKAISEEVAQLIIKAIDYTKERYGETTYIFVKKDDPTRPYQYGMIQNQIMKMIRQENIRDDNGEFLKFGTHIFRHCYGKKLTEMHVDDWMIAKLLGHTSIYSVHHYRKIGNKLMADETRAAREKMDMLLLDIVEGWDDYEI